MSKIEDVSASSEILNSITREMAEKFDTELCKAFVVEAGQKLFEDGIRVWYTQNKIKEEVRETDNGYSYNETYSIHFDGLDTSYHDKRIRAEAIEDVKHLLGGLEGSIYWYDGLCEKLNKLKEKKNG